MVYPKHWGVHNIILPDVGQALFTQNQATMTLVLPATDLTALPT